MSGRSDKKLVVGLDIGTSKIACLVGEVKADDRIEIIGLGTHPSRGLKKGVVDAAGGYDSAAEEHEERIVPRYFADSQEEPEEADPGPGPKRGGTAGSETEPGREPGTDGG